MNNQQPTTGNGGFESATERRRRRLSTRPAVHPASRVVHRIVNLFRADPYPQLLAEAAAGAQAPVTTGRRIAVVGSRGGAGKTTTTALLARVYAAMRPDAVAAIDNSVGAGTLGLRLGCSDAPSFDVTARRFSEKPPASLTELAEELAAVEPNLLATGNRTTADTAGAGAATTLSRTLSRFCPITFFDCGTGMEHHPTVWALEGAHLAVFVTPSSVAGLEDAQRYWDAWPDAATPLLVVVTATDPRSPFDAEAEAAQLTRRGINASHLPFDRHLSSGVEIDLALLADATRLQSTHLASLVLSAASGKQPATTQTSKHAGTPSRLRAATQR